MAIIENLTDVEINQLVKLPKYMQTQIQRGTARPEHGHSRFDVNLEAQQSNMLFSLKGRQNIADPTDFSVILQVTFQETGEKLILSRLNGVHPHKNPIENVSFFDRHIHIATQRYIELGGKHEHFAYIIGEEYTCFEEAIPYSFHFFNISPKDIEGQGKLPLGGME